jgi:hypothetical protein
VDWQYASTSGEELTDPVRSQYHEFLVLVNAVYEGTAVQTCPYIYVYLRRPGHLHGARLDPGLAQKLGQVHTTRPFPLPSPAAPQVGPAASSQPACPATADVWPKRPSPSITSRPTRCSSAADPSSTSDTFPA